MKKISLFLFFLIYSFNSTAHMAHYNKFNKIEMEILRDGEVIGYNYYFFKKDSDKYLNLSLQHLLLLKFSLLLF